MQKFLQAQHNLFVRTLGGGIRFFTDIAVCRVIADKAQLTTAVINLLLNAKDACKGRGEVHLSLKRELQPDGLGRIILRVQDSGCGMSQDVLDRAQNRFIQPRNRGEVPVWS